LFYRACFDRRHTGLASTLHVKRSSDCTTMYSLFASNPYLRFVSLIVGIGLVQTARTLLAAESFLVTAKVLGLPLPLSQKNLDQTWTDFVPSTHHDFITGTATDYVYLSAFPDRIILGYLHWLKCIDCSGTIASIAEGVC
jgi:hypothetical protein